jgi:hypothetical protein
MTTKQHPITPPPELVEQWINEPSGLSAVHVATQAARWGADQELEACCEWCADGSTVLALELRAARRPKPPSLAKQGCDALDTYIYGNPNHKDKERTYNTIRAALDRLKELEKGNE